MTVWSAQHLFVEPAYEADLRFLSSPVFIFIGYARVVEEYGDVKLINQRLSHRCAARSAAAVKKQGRLSNGFLKSVSRNKIILFFT